jgi:hypothetical protein
MTIACSTARVTRPFRASLPSPIQAKVQRGHGRHECTNHSRSVQVDKGRNQERARRGVMMKVIVWGREVMMKVIVWGSCEVRSSP